MNKTKYVPTGVSPLLSMMAVILFLLSFDRRTDGLCAILTWLLLLASVPRMMSVKRASLGELLAPRDLPISASLCMAGLCAWVCITVLSHFWSVNPLMTAESTVREILPQAGIFLLIINLREWLFTDSNRQVRVLANAYSVLAFIMMGILILQTFFGDIVGATFNDLRLILARPDEPQTPWRLLFPCNTHNRTAFFCFTAIFFIAGTLTFMPHPRRDKLWSVGLICLLVAVCATMTRALIVSLIIGIAILVVGLSIAHFNRRNTLLLAIVAILIAAGTAWQFTPQSWRGYMTQPFSKQAWTPGQETTTGMRLYLWQKTTALIEERPALGYGGGWEIYYGVFGKAFPEAHAQMPEREFPPHHCHNVPMQVCFETGIIGMAAFMLFMLSRLFTEIATAIAALRAGRGHDLRVMAMVCAVELSMLIYIMTNYPMRRGMGLMMFMIWAICYAATLNIHERQKNYY
ncbi:O-antigen ligase family protein [Candidatus Sumerlaeota bacterium]|nr:O-antigen ligase family protein [Candidatus Sumerlaeota bacterium]